MAAFGGGDAVPTVRGKLPPSGGGVPVFTGGNKRGQDTKYGFLSPLDSPDLPLGATPSGRASKNERRAQI